MLTFAVIVVTLSIGIALDVRHHRQMVADRQRELLLAIQPSDGLHRVAAALLAIAGESQ